MAISPSSITEAQVLALNLADAAEKARTTASSSPLV